MRRIIQSIPFIVMSPSFLVLDAHDNGSAIEYCQLHFDGSRWLLTVRIKHGAQHLRTFTSRDEAIEVMGGRRNASISA